MSIFTKRSAWFGDRRLVAPIHSSGSRYAKMMEGRLCVQSWEALQSLVSGPCENNAQVEQQYERPPVALPRALTGAACSSTAWHYLGASTAADAGTQVRDHARREIKRVDAMEV